MSEINLVVGVLLLSSIVGDYLDYRLDSSRIVLSICNNVKPVDEPGLFISKDGVLKVIWTQGSRCYVYDCPNDSVMFYLYNERTGMGKAYFDVAKRKDLLFEIDCPFDRKADMVHFWVFVASFKRRRVLGSGYIGGVFERRNMDRKACDVNHELSFLSRLILIIKQNIIMSVINKLWQMYIQKKSDHII